MNMVERMDWSHVAQISDHGRAVVIAVERLDWSHMAQNSDDGRALMNTVGKSEVELPGTE
jgi:hypothetical protein